MPRGHASRQFHPANELAKISRAITNCPRCTIVFGRLLIPQIQTDAKPTFAASPANRNSRYAGEGHQIRVCLLYPKWCTAAAELLTGPILDLIYAVPGRSAQHLFPLSYPAASMARRYYAHNSPGGALAHLAKISIPIEGDALLALIFSPQTPPVPRWKKEKIAQRRCRGLTRHLPMSLRRAFTYDKWSLRKRRPGIRFILQSTYSYQKSAMRRVRLKGGTATRQAAIQRSDGTLYEYQNFHFEQINGKYVDTSDKNNNA